MCPNGRLDHARNGYTYDNTKDSGEVLFLRTIPQNRLLGFCAYEDLKRFCSFDWVIDLFERTKTYKGEIKPLPYKDAIKQLGVDSELLNRLVISALTMHDNCDFQNPDSDLLSNKKLYDALLYSLRKSGAGDWSILGDSERVWRSMTSGLESEDEDAEGAENGETDLAEMLSGLDIKLGTLPKS